MGHAVDPKAIEIRLVIEAIHARYGYDLRNYATASLSRRVMAALAKSGLPHLGELQHRLLHDPGFFATVLEDLTVGVTEMFRDPDFFSALRARVMPLLRTYPSLRIWHAGCATGEEVYACAIVLHEAGLYDRCQIYATDVSARAIEHAKEGVYPLARVAEFAEAYARCGGTGSFSRYCTEGYGRVVMGECIRRNVLFFEHNLVLDQVFGEMHAILCRNVLIYFDKTLKHRVVEKFAQSLRQGGVLCLGASEHLSREDAELGFREFDPETRIYRYEPRPRDAGERR